VQTNQTGEPVTLDRLPTDISAVVTAVDRAAAHSRRLLDLGLTEGTRVCAVLAAPGGDPRAYLWRGTLIALRNRDARAVSVRLAAEGDVP